MPYLELLICLVSIFVGGGFLTGLADKISEKTGLGHHLMGTVFLAAVTSIPELGAGLSAAGWQKAPDIAMGAVMGSCCFNIMILGTGDLWSRKTMMAGGRPALLNGLSGIILISIAVLAVLGVGVPLGAIGASSILLVIVYILALEAARRSQAAERGAERAPGKPGELSRLWFWFSVAAALVIVPAVWLPDIADEIARRSGISHSLVGTFLVGAVTSTPEIIVTWHCIRAGFTHMAMANMLGSNMFNMLTIAPMDGVYTEGSIYRAVGPEHAVMGMFAIMMTAVVMAASRVRTARRHNPRLRWEGILICALYLASFAYLYSV
ncbi:MAG: hypothetical protein O7C98_13150 [Planctomycetota bacterium]|nr:hypothetical protein [Planctomycetota bacterium]